MLVVAYESIVSLTFSSSSTAKMDFFEVTVRPTNSFNISEETA